MTFLERNSKCKNGGRACTFCRSVFCFAPVLGSCKCLREGRFLCRKTGWQSARGSYWCFEGPSLVAGRCSQGCRTNHEQGRPCTHLRSDKLRCSSGGHRVPEVPCYHTLISPRESFALLLVIVCCFSRETKDVHSSGLFLSSCRASTEYDDREIASSLTGDLEGAKGSLRLSLSSSMCYPRAVSI